MVCTLTISCSTKIPSPKHILWLNKTILGTSHLKQFFGNNKTFVVVSRNSILLKSERNNLKSKFT